MHFLCLFNPSVDAGYIERVIGDCGIHNGAEPSPTGKYDAVEFLEEAKRWDAACVAAHVCSGRGPLTVLSGQPRIKAWKSPHLLACSLPGPVKEAPQAQRRILENKDAHHRRERPIAVLNVQDISDPTTTAQSGSSCWIKMSEPTIE